MGVRRPRGKRSCGNLLNRANAIPNPKVNLSQCDSASDSNAGRFGVSNLVGRIGPVGRTTLGIITIQTRQLLIQRVAQGHLQEKPR